jgi:tetratricopeptide (TPR) repeat protein
MMRELASALDEVSSVVPVVLVCEDLHSADRPSVELLSYLARRPHPARLLTICTYRPAEAAAHSRPVRAAVSDLRARGHCQFLALELLSPMAVGTYLARRLTTAPPSRSLVEEVHRRTEGNALFMTMLVDYLVEHDLLVAGGDGLHYREETDRLDIPDTVCEFIDCQLDGLTATDQVIVEIAAAVGVEFSAEAVVAAAGRDDANATSMEVEERLAVVARDVGLLTDAGIVEWPDGTLTTQYRFRHEIYQERLYTRIAPRRRAAIHRRVGERLAAAYGPRSGEIAAELAMHFERGNDDDRAVHFLSVAASTALQRIAHREALDYASKGLRLLDRSSAIVDRAGAELRLRMTQTVALATLHGFGAPGVDVAYERALAACADIDDPTVLAPLLYGLWNFAINKRTIGDAAQLAGKLCGLARERPDPVLELQAEYANGFNEWVAGRPADALARLERCLELYDSRAHRNLALTYGDDPAVGAHRCGGVAAWMLGHPDRARDHAHLACAIAADLGYPTELAQAASFATAIHVMCRDVERASASGDVLAKVADEYDLPVFASIGRIFGGWVIAQRGEPERGVAAMRDGLAEFAVSVNEGGLHFLTSLLAEALVGLGDTAAALEAATEGLRIARRAGQLWYEAEHVRLRGELLLAGAASDEQLAEAEGALLESLAIARRQEARSFELRAATSLARMWHRRGETRRARSLLAESYGSISEGHDTGDLQAAAGLLDELGDTDSDSTGAGPEGG